VKRKTSHQDPALARRIRAAGVPIYIQEDDSAAANSSSDELFIRQFGGITESAAFDYYGGAGFVIYLVITIGVPAFAISAFELQLPWTNKIRWLEDPSAIDGIPRAYHFGHNNAIEYGWSEVLNHRADVRRIIPRGHSLEGCLLGIADEGIPNSIGHGAMIPGTLSVLGQFGRPYASEVSLWADRSQWISHAGPKQRSRRSIFDYPDRVPGEGKKLP
jgi:hypothetical protein